MHRVDTSTAVATLPTQNPAGTPGYFWQGNPGLATVPGQDWFNAMQEEVVAPILAAGLTLDKANNAQLLAALQKLFFSTGDVKLTLKAVSDPGWVMANDGTIGNAASGGTTRAHADTEALFTLLWNNVSNTYAPVSGGRGASATADFAANKTIALTKMLGRALAISGSGAGLTARVLGQTLGAETHQLSQGETPVKSHAHGIADPGHAHTVNDLGHAHGVTDPTHNHGLMDPSHGHNWDYMSEVGTNAGAGGYAVGVGVQQSVNAAPTGIQLAAAGTGISINGAGANISVNGNGTGISVQAAADAAAAGHNNMPPESFVNAMIKL